MNFINFYKIKFFILYVFVLSLSIFLQCESTTIPQYDCFVQLYQISGRVLDQNQVSSISDVCNYMMDYVECDDSSNIIKINIAQVPGNAAVTGDKMICFEYLTEIELTGFTLSSDFLTGSNFIQSNVKVTLINPIQYTLDTITPSIKSLSIYTQTVYNPPNSIYALSFDIFKDLEELNLVDTTNTGQQLISFSPQTTLTSTKKSYNIFSKSLPSLANMVIENIKIDLQDGYVWSILEYDTYKDVTGTIDVSSKDLNQCITSSDVFSPSYPMSAKELNINLCLINNDIPIDIKNGYPELVKFKFSSNPQIFQSSTFPFNTIPDTLEEFTLKSAGFNNLAVAYDLLRNVNSVYFAQNTITSNVLPENEMSPGVNRILSLSYNSLHGSIPQSYCKVEDLDVSFNLLSGAIPECFHCYYSVAKFINNPFTNINQIGNCENKIKPSLRVDIASKRVYLEGKNLGFSSQQITTSPPLVWSMQIPSELFIADYSQYIQPGGSIDKTFTLLFTTPNKWFTLRTIRLKPTITQVTTFYSTAMVHFIGQDFVYDYSNMAISVNEYTCSIINSTYTDVYCLLSAPLSILGTNMKTYITVMDYLGGGLYKDYSKQITIDFSYQTDLTSNIISCPGDCYGYGTCYSSLGSCICNANLKLSNQNTCALNCGSYGSFNTSTALCDCVTGYTGQYCDVPLVQCLNNCSNAGSCNTVNGVCTCIDGRVGNDCSQFTCLNNCTWPQGDCNSSDGSCTCTSLYYGSDCGLKLCPNSCSNAGFCNSNSGICTCINGRTGHDCSLFTCPNNCLSSSSQGTCNPNNGTCTCNSNFEGVDCSGIKCKQTCLNGGVCNNKVGSCVCKANWKGESCATPVHYISSVEPCSVSGGQVIIYGWFGQIHEGLNVTIGDLECKNRIITESSITCTLEGGSGTKNVNVTQNDSSFIGRNKFQYYNKIMTCPNNCTDELKGVCDSSTGQCICSNSWSGFDCSLLKSTPSSSSSSVTQPEQQEIPKSTTTVDIETAKAMISNQDVNYQISIISLVEFDLAGNEVKTNYLQKKWDTLVSENSIYQFSQTIDSEESDEEPCLVTYTIEEANKTKDYEFAGLKLTIEEGSIKVSVNISNYQFKNALNTLQLRFLSAAGQDNSNNNLNQCNQQDSKVNIDNIDPNQTLNYITITKNNRQLSGRFINKLESDSRYTFMTSEVIKDLSNSSSIVVGLNLPHCVDFCLIDPDFSVLVSSEFKSKCGDNDKSSKSWLVPVAVVIPCVALVAIIIGSFFIYRKYRYQIRLFVHKKSNLSLRNSFKLKRKSKLYGYNG